MYKPGRRLVAIALVSCALLGALGVWVLLHPASIFVQPWRAERSVTASDDVLLGPYPVEADFIALKQRGVTTIISLLEPNVPYEKVLLEQERELAARHGMTVRNFPMGSILGQKFGNDYAKNSKAAAEAALGADGVAYIHCYLGLHRARNVQAYLAANVRSTTFAGTNATTDADHVAERRAKAAFEAGDYAGSLAILATITRKTARVLRVEAWNHYRLLRIAEARVAFGKVLEQQPGDRDALTGLAYCDLFENRLDAADQGFDRVLATKPDEVFALEGLGHVRYRQSRWPEAEAIFARAASLNPANPETRQMLERIRTATTVPRGTPVGSAGASAAPAVP
jgi:tetratricopeptide (TPR) repeat protein